MRAGPSLTSSSVKLSKRLDYRVDQGRYAGGWVPKYTQLPTHVRLADEICRLRPALFPQLPGHMARGADRDDELALGQGDFDFLTNPVGRNHCPTLEFVARQHNADPGVL